MRTALLLLAALHLSTIAPAQGDEAPFLVKAADALDEQASRCEKSGFHHQARELWREVIAHYAPDHEHARAGLGFVRVGTSWAPDPKFERKDADEADAATARVLARQFEATSKTLAAGHRELGTALQAAGNAERARWHFERTLRFAPADATASAATGRKSVEGLFGSDVELELLKRSRALDRTIQRLLAQDYAVTPMTGQHPLLQKANLAHVGVESERFVVWGNWDQAVLEDCCKSGERAFAFCTEFFAGVPGYQWHKKGKLTFLLLKSKDEWRELVRANANRLMGNDLEFVLANTSATGLSDGGQTLLTGGLEQDVSARDYVVRQVAWEWGGLGCDAVKEGFGHAIVGWFFGRNLIFSVGQQKGDGRTSTKADAQKFNMPDLAIWAELAADLAWDKTDTPAAKLPTISAADFTSVDRIKAWSFCEYLLRRDPKLVRALDASRSTSLDEVAKRFAEKSGGITLADLELEWRRFWTEDSAILRAIRNKQTPLEAVSKRAPEFLDAFNRLRKQYDGKDVGWSSEYSADCRQHGLYLEANKGERGPGKEHTQDAGKKHGSLAGRSFAEKALIASDAGDPRDTLESWMAWPGYRDAVLNPALVIVGLWTEGKLLVMDVARGLDASVNQAKWYPGGVTPGSPLPSDAGPALVVPNEVAIQELGPEVELLLAGRGKKGQKTIGWPITMHFFKTGSLPIKESIRCTVKLDGKKDVPGVVHVADRGVVRRSAAPGLVVFYPLAPLERGSRYTVTWEWEKGGLAAPKPYQFFTK